jgi:hypothetical protein
MLITMTTTNMSLAGEGGVYDGGKEGVPS